MEASITVSHSFQCHPRDALRALCAALLTSAATSRNSLASSTHAAPVWRWAFSHSAACGRACASPFCLGRLSFPAAAVPPVRRW